MKGNSLMTLLLMLLCFGCLQETIPPLVDTAPTFDEAMPRAAMIPDQQPDQLPENVPVGVVTQKPVQAEQPAKPAGFTGAEVYVGDNCAPCHWLLADLQMLKTDYGWRVTEGDSTDSDWVILRNKPAPSYPTIVFFRDGQRISQSSGYVVSANFEDRREALRQLCRSHPKER